MDRHTLLRVGLAPAGLLLTSAVAFDAPAAPSSIVDVVDRSGGFSAFSAPSLNNESTIAFVVYKPAPRPGFPVPHGVYVTSGATTTPLVESTGLSSGFWGVGVNDVGEVAYVHDPGSIVPGRLTGSVTVYRAAVGQAPVAVADNLGAFGSIHEPVVIDQGGRVVFNADQGDPFQLGIYTGPSPSANRVVDSSQFSSPVLQSVRRDGTLFFRITKPGATTAMYRATGGATSLALDLGDSFDTFNNATEYSENLKGDRVFNAFMLTRDTAGVHATRAIFTGADPVADRFVDTSGPIDDIGAVLLNEAGTIVYQATLDDGRRGLFDGPDVSADKIVATGDTLFGSTVTAISFGQGLNDANQVAFAYTLADGRQGIAMATVPEPTGLGFVGAVAASLFVRRRARRG